MKEVEIENVGLLQIGTRITHALFGDGLVTAFKAGQEVTMMEVKFDSSGLKWIVPEFANIKIIT